ncbi:helix-turn-helix domain-containing protein [Pararcticibacter amylolyticus]|uniref:AraC family transcriptional regulator n=1 Tax=Pararcticibacter amylolyticus TaxID=2173175 RepID=A0A2U2PFZ2_9SPHI|nr:helix-turn-helix domain-containing protein [Pararcticibacter amylolyticus]PWG80325.1 AraC family transcriptional regulator [Pararcticibacter amylolyticus]
MIEIFQNIREIYDFTAPCGELMPYIEFFSESSAEKCELYFDRGHASVTMFESWTPTFYINLTGGYVIDVGGKHHNIGNGKDILILRNGLVTRHNQPGDRIFTVKFYPGGLEAVLGLNQVSMGDRVVSLNRILPQTLLTMLKGAVSFIDRITIMEKFLLTAMRGKVASDYYSRIVLAAIGEYTTTDMQLNTSKIAERLFISSKSINRYFNRVVGVAPKSYFSVLRARTALTAMVGNRNDFKPWIYGYYDPAHFYKDVFRFTGRKISEVL